MSLVPVSVNPAVATVSAPPDSLPHSPPPTVHHTYNHTSHTSSHNASFAPITLSNSIHHPNNTADIADMTVDSHFRIPPSVENPSDCSDCGEWHRCDRHSD